MTTKTPKEGEIHKDTLLKEGYKEEALVKGFKIYTANPEGCDNCSGGYKGRVAIYQVMPISEEMKHLIIERRQSIDFADQARKDGIPDLRESGLKKVRDGVTSLAEVNRVTLE